MEASERFAAIVRGPEPALRLDEAALTIAAHRYPQLDVAAQLSRLDDLAAGCPGPTLDQLLAHLFIALGFTGDRLTYDDERNAFLNDVLDRRTGLPITLAVVTLEVGRRIGVPLAPVGMPGHFLLRDRVDPTVFIDPFAGGRIIDAEGAAALHRALHGSSAHLEPEHLAPVGGRAVVARILTNLDVRYRAAGRTADRVWVQRLLTAVPGIPVEQRRVLAGTLAALGRFDHAAAELEAAADLSAGADADALRSAARALRARLS